MAWSDCAISSTCRTLMPWSTMRRATACGSLTESRARPWPAVIWRVTRSAFTGSGRSDSRIMLAMWLRLLPMIFARFSWV